MISDSCEIHKTSLQCQLLLDHDHCCFKANITQTVQNSSIDKMKHLFNCVAVFELMLTNTHQKIHIHFSTFLMSKLRNKEVMDIHNSFRDIISYLHSPKSDYTTYYSLLHPLLFFLIPKKGQWNTKLLIILVAALFVLIAMKVLFICHLTQEDGGCNIEQREGCRVQHPNNQFFF